ncbi:hypothetical protein BU200_00955 [Streptococcus acidominimus]|uniref:Uncharacterized protein n=1 Tax=Streptococcus acidominimus TaxID=1326 RepID=A0A1Q8EFQ9_STRAI|nr:hypothetical protein BU200_00955 [Streptococcus acidominimus]SUN05244.1 Uncharacterised protein [Streptococcus acidominimus]SUN41216.1 Uncharacterised protein [Streptococcus acidominimus]
MTSILHYINILNRSDLKKYSLIGLNSELLLSKDLFKHNSEISMYLSQVFSIEFLPYVMRSRTMIVARLTREIYKYDEKQINLVRKKMLKYLKSINVEKKQNKLEGGSNLLSWY